MDRKPFIAGNWKMNTTLAEAVRLAGGVAEAVKDLDRVDVAVFPPFTALHAVAERLRGTAVAVGAQDLFWEKEGAYTGEISAIQIRDAGASHALIGHSERRHVIGETDDLVRRKLVAALKGGLLPVVCVGERLEEREAGRTFEVVGSQIEAALRGLDDSESGLVTVAYEPVWAIGTGKNATPEQAEEVHRFIRTRLKDLFGAEEGAIRILYGGSAKPANAAELLSQPHVDGLLVGGASLDAKGFGAIARSVR